MNVRRTRNDRDFWVCAYDPSVQYVLLDGNGNQSGETAPKYNTAVPMYANISPASGAAQFESFGNMGNYDKVIVTRDMSVHIGENDVLFIDKEPEYTTVTAYELADTGTVATDESYVAVTYNLPKYDYIVKRIAIGLDAIAIAVRKVDVG